MKAPLGKEKAVSWVEERIEFLDESLSSKGPPEAWGGFVFFIWGSCL